MKDRIHVMKKRKRSMNYLKRKSNTLGAEIKT